MSQPQTCSQDQPFNVNVNNSVLLDSGSNIHAHIEGSIKLLVYTHGRSTVAIMNARAGSGMSSLSSVPIFNGDRNKFKEFKRFFLGYCELQNVVEGLTQKKLSEDDKKDKDKLASWSENNNKCMGLFKMKLESLLQHFIKKTAKLTWNVLITEYDKFNLAEIFEWFSVLTAVNIGKGQNPTDAYNLIQTCLIKLKEEQIEIADWMVSIILMKALPDFAVSTLYSLIQREWSRRNLSSNIALVSWITSIRPAQGYQTFRKQNNCLFHPNGGNTSSGSQAYCHLNFSNQSNASFKQGGNQQHKQQDQKKKPGNQKQYQEKKKSNKGKRQNTFVAAFDEGEEATIMAFATAISEEGGTSDEAEDSEMETQLEYSNQSSQASDEEDAPDVKTLSLASRQRSSAPLHQQQSIKYQTEDGEIISDQEVEDPF
ncbi:hypothetical protein Moror_15807 [Moniliophthora roreri MCA 2997]|uniref:Uncharacterized protein n=1 Tax=Moniliophthora roreri (strain MCA 2997) TaxID=1381753 RepID=V2W3S8_MONRO|nr:hypothetical protein Moror_15807 [Moniliophthora roreri MCA 2997]